MNDVKEISKLIYSLGSSEEQNSQVSEKFLEMVLRFEQLFSQLKKEFTKKDEEYGQAFELLIKETDKQVKYYLKTIQKDYDSKVSSVNTLLNVLEDKVSSSDIDLRAQIKDAKIELKDFSSKVLDSHKVYRDDTVSTISDLVEKSQKIVTEANKESKSLDDKIDSLRKDLIGRFSKLSADRGGSAHFQIAVNGVVATVRYADINIVSAGASFSNNDTTKRTNINIPGGGGGGGGFQQPTGTVNGTNKVFVWSTEPNVIIVDQGRAMQKVSSDGTVNWTGTTTTTLTEAPQYDIYATA